MLTTQPPGFGEQEAVIAFLSRPATYGLPDTGLPDTGVERIDTHCSIVFLAADCAYKLKRAIRYASLDYTTTALRRAACEAELVLNRRTAPTLYLGVRSINRDSHGALAFDGAGPALDYVVVMRRFAQSDLFDRMADDGGLTPALMSSLGQAIARLHLSAQIMPAYGGSDAIRHVIEENDREHSKVAAELDGAAVGTLSTRSRAELRRIAGLLDQRRTEGKVRRCHGDLRLANICLWSDKPTLFDCIDFSDEIGCIDVLYDLAFLLMDLWLRGLHDLGNIVFNAYLDEAPETNGVAALPLFLALRAGTRSYALAGSAHRRTDPALAASLLASARLHIEAGIDFLAPQHPSLILLGGGDDSVRREIASGLASVMPPVPGARVLHPTPSTDRAFSTAAGLLRGGCSVVLEGPFMDRNARKTAATLAEQFRVRPLGFWLGKTPPEPDDRLWRPVDVSRGASIAVADVTATINATQPPRPPGPDFLH